MIFWSWVIVIAASVPDAGGRVAVPAWGENRAPPPGTHFRKPTNDCQVKFKLIHNVQIAVDAEHHLIVAHEVTNQGYDRHQLAPMALKAQQATGWEKITALADRGYFNGDQVLLCEGTGVSPVVPKTL